jgi:putative iron-dependent peroxidase
VATPGELLFHIRAERGDLCFELEKLILDALGASNPVKDEVQGFRYFDDRDLLGFLDGTENPTDNAMYQAALIGDEDAVFAGGAYVVVQKYLHDLTAWSALMVSEQEAIIGRAKSPRTIGHDNAPGCMAVNLLRQPVTRATVGTRLAVTHGVQRSPQPKVLAGI